MTDTPYERLRDMDVKVTHFKVDDYCFTHVSHKDPRQRQAGSEMTDTSDERVLERIKRLTRAADNPASKTMEKWGAEYGTHEPLRIMLRENAAMLESLLAEREAMREVVEAAREWNPDGSICGCTHCTRCRDAAIKLTGAVAALGKLDKT